MVREFVVLLEGSSVAIVASELVQGLVSSSDLVLVLDSVSEEALALVLDLVLVTALM